MSSSPKDTCTMSWEEYTDSLYIPYEEIESATNDFADENFLAQGTSFKVYKGQLLQSGDFINIVARRSHQTELMIKELLSSKSIKHKNIASVFKYTGKNDEVFIINKHEVNGSLEKHLSGPTLTWRRRLHICVRIAHALKYLHHDVLDGNRCIIHGTIKSSKILLDHNWEPKLHGFGFAFNTNRHHLHITSKYNGSLQYMDPAYESTRGLTHMSDVFSFGVLLFEVLFSGEASLQNNDNWDFARLARSHYEDRKLDDLIDPDLRKQMNMQSLNIFAETAYYCLKEKRSQRLEMHQVLSNLKKARELQHKHGKRLDLLKFGLRNIELATNEFSEMYCIGSGGYGKVYKAQLNLDEINLSATEGKNKGEVPKKHDTVAIKRIFSRMDKQGKQGFIAELEILNNCKHPNIVSLRGFCDEGEEMILVYEYVSNGSLADYFENVNNMTNLTWVQRIQICLDIARGLKYLHTNTEDKQSIIHRDIKSANILLDDSWVAKISDFGLSKLRRGTQQGSTLFTDNIAGTEVYLDPEYLKTGKLKTKSDVYSFGVVLFEIMCGKLAYDKTYNEGGLPLIARKCFKEGTLKNLVDPKMMEVDENIYMLTRGVNQDSLDTFTKVAYQCLAETQSDRPTMEVIIEELEKALNFQVSISFQWKKWNFLFFSAFLILGTGSEMFVTQLTTV
ncbi:putative protein kinase RLK-Pelle-CrRLK1L-1 family [Helianthus debilis subsp. tardiflorus]